ncbi:hypothetical protein [Rhizobium rhizogenes]|uniref:hypothetical protein n=1 Tax=Rhizobium rhizogenes TaxID=359 RepID=UPI0024BD9BD2|nr:hypothetical protein [Rhizobium rhizogenes]MDJ1632518.1 hypothetical protein [Rhizobium rhizogenes]
MRDIISNIAVLSALAPAVQAAVADGLTIDTLGFNSLAFAINTGAIVGAGDFGVKLADSDDGSAFTDVAAAQVKGSVPTTLAANSAYKLGYVGFKRYVRASLTKSGGTSIALGVLAILGDASDRPVA